MRCSASKIATLFLREGASPEALYMGWPSHESTGEGAFTDIMERCPPRQSQDVQELDTLANLSERFISEYGQ
jgi:hypothetical protein